MSERAGEVRYLTNAVARYFRQHPRACDTLDGIARWWLERPAPSHELQAALDLLGRDGIVEAVHATDGRTRYRLFASPDTASRLDALIARSTSAPERSS